MKLKLLTPKQSLTLAYLRQRPIRTRLDVFKKNLMDFLEKVEASKNENEEHAKNLIRDFLQNSFYKDTNYINTKGRADLAIHNGKTIDDNVGVIIETKKPDNKTEMPANDSLNCKALQELVLYYLRERSDIKKNIDIKYLIITDAYKWYILEAGWFEKHFFRNNSFLKQYEDWNKKKKVTSDTELFYSSIAKPFIDSIDEEIHCTYFDLRKYEVNLALTLDQTAGHKGANQSQPQPSKGALNGLVQEENKGLIALYKILSPGYLLKVGFEDDSNKLDEKFYKELLHIIGLEEAKEGSKYVIRRKAKPNPGSLLENAISSLETEGIDKLPDINQYGATPEERNFNIALELCITWINRILFLKLLEGQLVNYHDGDRKYLLLNSKIIPDYGELFKFFHKVLAVDIKKRDSTLQKKYSYVPYLNSSLFEISELESDTIKINSLDHSLELELIDTTILKEERKRIYPSSSLSTLDYLFKFLNAYDFASESTEDIDEENKTLINASVLGKVFEKINGYKDGSIFTPGFITMYMCRQAIRLAVIQKFKDTYKWNINEFDDLKNYIIDRRTKNEILEFNELINSLHICDPAVGSGHFLVSALNEIIAIKSELGILADKTGILLECDVNIINDELNVFIDKHGDVDFFEYKVYKGEVSEKTQRIQKTLFLEKQTIIENCLFGVDINPNSVKICRLRLWIELLKSAYYREENSYSDLETLPNIDINIKCGNSLVSRFPLDSDLKKALKSIKYDIAAYRGFVNDYKNANDRELKRGLEKIINAIKQDFHIEIGMNDPKVKKLLKLQYEFNLLVAPNIFKDDEVDYGNKNYKKEREEKIKMLESEINKQSKEIEEIKNNPIFKNALEWRFEFPEVLNNNGDFEGFDIVIGNPPYYSLSTNLNLKFFANTYLSYSSTGDIYALFYELGQRIIRSKGIEALIISNKWMRANYGETLRKYIIKNSNPIYLIDFGQNLLFGNAIVHSNIIISLKDKYTNELSGFRFEDTEFQYYKNDFPSHIAKNFIRNLFITEGIWNIIPNSLETIKTKIEKIGKPLREQNIVFNYGIKTGYNDAFIINKETREYLIKEDPKNEQIIKPILRGRDTRRYYCNFAEKWLLNCSNGLIISIKNPITDVIVEDVGFKIKVDNDWRKVKRIEWLTKDGFKDKARIDRVIVEIDYPVIYKYLQNYSEKAKVRFDKGDHWTNLRNCAYIKEFEKDKIIFSEIVSEPQFYYDTKKYYPEATCFFISGEDLKYLVALLNSKPVTFFFKSFYMGGELMGKIRYKKAFVEQIPIPKIDKEKQQLIFALVDKIIALKEQSKDTSTLEAKIDVIVYELYGLTKEEISIVEGKG